LEVKRFLKMFSKNLFEKIQLNQCCSCASWTSGYEKIESRVPNTSSSVEKMRLCVGGGFDGSHTLSDETCSLWKPLLDKDRVMPIFYPKHGDEG
jgi:hypothetical protein